MRIASPSPVGKLRMTSSDNEQGADDLIREEDAEPTMLERTIVLDETEETAHLTGIEDADVDGGGGGEDTHAGGGGDEAGAQDRGDDRPLLFPDDSFNISYPLIMPEEQAGPDLRDVVAVELQQPVVENLPVRTQPLVSSQDPQRRRINLTELSDPLVGRKKVATILIQEEFFGVYCLISRSELKQYKNRCYIGYTVDPNRRIRQHNAGKQHGGAQKTDNKGPWDMVCIIHGFPNAVSALRFEWAWQNPEKSRRLREMCDLKKTRKESPFQFRLRIVGKMLNSDPWRRLSLTVRWLIPECEIPFPLDVRPPLHMTKEYGKVEKSNIVVPAEVNEYTMLKPCYLCQSTITTRTLQIKHLLRCPRLEGCGSHFHARCLAEDALRLSGEVDVHLVPLTLNCPSCGVECAWSDLVRDQHNLLLVDGSKPKHEGVPIAGGMVPAKLVKK